MSDDFVDPATYYTPRAVVAYVEAHSPVPGTLGAAMTDLGDALRQCANAIMAGLGVPRLVAWLAGRLKR